MRETERETPTLPVAETPSLDLVFDLLADQRRRYALYYLYDSPDGVAAVDEIAAHVVSLENESHADDPQDHVVTTLQHVHLPKLEDAGVVEHDPRSETVRYWSQPSLEEWLEHAQHKEVL
ncbi:DUF7344 domain-containing protein [Natronoglomus mannanivorans]|uniref:DUF7344 domain-containing protein n=1 Tax=Natronoglomus mannanivorans TaxID=2979990 RepID=A0AAP2YWP3_9EURY|nr:hypothetical protein [Halobacteria archaeon AArc-xg1-1]